MLRRPMFASENKARRFMEAVAKEGEKSKSKPADAPEPDFLNYPFPIPIVGGLA